MPTYINCPFAEKDAAKSLGAKWDGAQKSWYVPDTVDLAKFSRWFRPEKPRVSTMSLREYLARQYGYSPPSMTVKAAKAFGVPYPLKSGWVAQYGENRVPTTQAELLFHSKKKTGKAATPKDHHPTRTTGMFTALCNCDVPPWEDCEHTEALAHRAMQEILGCQACV
jgi:hypothetical protein